MTPALFTYEVLPSSIDYSASTTSQSIVALTMQVTNNSGAFVACTSIVFTIPPGPSGNDLTSLSDSGLIVATTGLATPWAIATSGVGSFVAMPLPPSTGLDPNQTIEFIFSNVVVNTLAGTVAITVEEMTVSQPGGGQALPPPTVVKTTPSSASGAQPQIVSFTATPNQVALSGQTLLVWEVTGATSCVLDPGSVLLASSYSGTLPLIIPVTTSYTLTASSSGGTVTSSPVSVTVMPVVIASFSSSIPSPVAPGTSVTLQWSTKYASSCSIDQGIGPVVVSGSTVVTPQQTTTYTLTANGLNPQTLPVTITVQAGQ